jgi:predicted  nucleic acid-binding Zn-ribbon protein
MNKNGLILGALSFGVGFGLSLSVERDIKRAALTGLITLPATATGVAVVEYRRKQQVCDTLSGRQAQVAELEQREHQLNQSLSQLQNQTQALDQSIATATTEKQQVDASLNTGQTELEQLQTQVATQQRHQQELERAIASLTRQKQELEQDSAQLHAQLQARQDQETTLNYSLSAIAAEKQRVEADIASLNDEFNQLQTQVAEEAKRQADIEQERRELEQQQHQLTLTLAQLQDQIAAQEIQLQDQIAAQETQTSQLSQELADLEQQRHQLESYISNLESQIDTLEQERTQLNQSLTTVTDQQQDAENSLNALQTEISSQQQIKAQLTQELAALASQKEQLTDQRRQLEIPPQPTQDTPISVDIPKKAQKSTASPPISSRTSQGQITELDADFMNANYTKHLWEEQILPHWSHRDRPTGQRFLGSIRIKRTASDQLLDIVGQNLQQLDRVTYNSLHDEFYELEQNWLKVLTFALSEYAYYYSSERFWQGFCERLEIHHNQGVENTLRQVVDEGINLLGLVRATGGYKYVSTLWLQSGVPEQNLGHFAQLVQEIADDYGWWELAHTPAADLSPALLNFCQENHPQWGTLINFLNASYSEDGETEPISGQLLQGIAIVAQELERQGVSPSALQNEHQREELLGSYYLPHNFFLRNWNALIQVLTPKTGSGQSRSLVRRRSQPLVLSLDIIDTGNTQLILPEQTLWKPEWRDLRDTYCQIPEANWENTIPRVGDLEIPELAIDVNQASEDWSCQLLDHNRKSLLKWHYAGITRDFPCLVFDAVTGDHLPLNLPNPTIIGVEEIICFTPKELSLQFANGIEVLDSCIPSSIRGWRGQQIALTAPESSIVLTVAETEQSQRIRWRLAEAEKPVLRGLKLKGKKAIYIEAPTFWYPPLKQPLTLNVLIENITEKSIMARTLETLYSNNRWVAIPLNQWITEPGSYEARFWFETQRWFYRFEVQSNYQVDQIPELNKLKIRSRSGLTETDLPIKHDTPERFWAETIKIEGLWTLEEVILFLSNREDKIPYHLQADASGSLIIDLPILHELLPESNWYALDYQRLGLEPQRLLEMDSSQQEVSWTWGSQGIQLSGLRSGDLYTLSCWNLLLPDTKPREIKIPLETEPTGTIKVPLELPTGIYYIQLWSSQQLPQTLGWWCGSNQYDLPEDTNENEALENYCYTILDQEPTPNFIEAVKKLNPDFDLQQIQAGIASLEEHGYNFPEWLNPDALVSQLKGLLNVLELPPVQPIQPPDSPPPVEPKEPSAPPPVSGTWYLVNVRHKKRDLFLRCLKAVIEQNKLQDMILAVETPDDSVYEDIVLLNLANFKAARTPIQSIESCQRIEPKPLPPAHVNRMLGAR